MTKHTTVRLARIAALMSSLRCTIIAARMRRDS